MNKNRIERIKELVEKNPSGFTVSYRTLKPVIHGYAVGLTNWTFEDFIKASDEVANQLRGLGRLTIGGWKDKDGKYFVDLGITVKNYDKAKRIGKQFNQKAIFDLDTMQEIPL